MLGILFLNGKGSFLIAGYNTASKAEKETIDERKLCNYVGKLMFLIAGCFLILMASDIFHKMCVQVIADPKYHVRFVRLLCAGQRKPLYLTGQQDDRGTQKLCRKLSFFVRSLKGIHLLAHGS